MALLCLGACSSLPEDGPSAKGVTAGASAAGVKSYAIVDLDYRTAGIILANPPRIFATLVPATSPARNDLIREGDQLAVSVYEAGAGPRADSSRDSGGAEAGGQTYPRVVVDRNGEISLPFAGVVRVAGLTAADAAQAVRGALRGKAINPQVLVTVLSSQANMVTVIGEVKAVGRYPIAANGDRLFDLLAAAGGPTKPAEDVEISVIRGSQVVSAPLSLVMNNTAENIRLAPGDQVRLVYKPRRFSTFGALGHVTQAPIQEQTLTLAGALGQAGGLDNNTANAASVLLFRFERPEVARALGLTPDPALARVPIIYRLNLREPSGYFIAQTFEIQADDLIYVPRAGAAEMRKFLGLVTDISQVAYDVAVARVVR
jgi:polysaccharide export outer membrane protein